MDSDKHLHQAWIPSQKGVYEPPPRDRFPNVICRKIKISNHIDRNIHHFIGKDGRHFVDWTSNFKVLYVYYRNQHIEIWGENPQAVYSLIHFIINKIKVINKKRYDYFQNQKEENETIMVSKPEDEIDLEPKEENETIMVSKPEDEIDLEPKEEIDERIMDEIDEEIREPIVNEIT